MDDLQNFDDGLFTNVGKAIKSHGSKKRKKLNMVRMIHDVKSIAKIGFQGVYSLYSLVAGRNKSLKQST